MEEDLLRIASSHLSDDSPTASCSEAGAVAHVSSSHSDRKCWTRTMLAFLKATLASNSLVKAFIQPGQVDSCAPVSLYTQLYPLPGVIQCGLLYPPFDRYSWARWLRLALTPCSVYLSLKLPVDYCFTPTDRRGYANLALACTSFIMAAKGVEWGTLTDFRLGRFARRPEFLPDTAQGSIKATSPQLLSSSQAPEILQSHSFSLRDWFAWTLEVLSSPRGQQYEWGIKTAPNTESVMDIVKRMYILNTVHVFAIGFAVLSRDQGRATNALRYLGLPSFYGEGILAEGLLTLSFGFYIMSILELAFGYIILLIHLINYTHTNVLTIPTCLMRLCDLKLFHPLFHQPHRSNSLAILWGKAWHQLFRQPFLVLGGFPAACLAKSFRLTPKFQRLAGMLGCFFVSAVLHEYAIHLVARHSSPEPRAIFDEFPGSFIYFMLQPMGILVEPYLIRFVPGGGIVWTWFFTLVTATPFRRQYFKDNRLLDRGYPPFNMHWFITSLLLPCSASNFI